MKTNLIVIDDIMLFAVQREIAVAFINQIYDTSIANEEPTEWAKILDGEVIATVLLDRMLYHCEIIKQSGDSYRMKNRKSFFENQNH